MQIKKCGENEIKSGVNIEKIFENLSSKEIIITMSQDSVMKEHKAEGEIYIQILKGEMEFSVESEKIILKELDIINLEANIAHSLKAIKDTMIRLTLSKNDSEKRVFRVIKG